jgi:exopolyphosphatase/guanosine-5'-triphosphate,3'-diphosphate pyrophosphatase
MRATLPHTLAISRNQVAGVSRPGPFRIIVFDLLTCAPLIFRFRRDERVISPGTFCDMRLGVLDVGSNTVHLLVVDAHPGARPLPAFSHKVELSLAAHLERDNTLSAVGEERLTEVVAEAIRMAEDKGVEDFMAFATSAVRDAGNADDVLARIANQTGVSIRVLSGENEARLTFLAARRWFGWSAGRLLVVDIGGGSLEVAAGQDEEPEAVMSLPLGAGRLTRDWFTADPPPPGEVRALRRHVRAQIARLAGPLRRGGAVDQAVGTSKTFRQLARIAGAAPSSEGFYAKRFLTHADVSLWTERLSTMDRGERARLPGVSEGRAAQMPAGAIVADAVMDLMSVGQLEICPWALREGVILKHLDMLADPATRGLTPRPDVPA